VPVNFQGELNLLGHVPVEPLQAAVSAFDEARWSEDQSRQKRFDAHSSTSTVKLIFDADYRHRDPTVHPAFGELRSLIEPAIALIRTTYSQTMRQRRWIARHGEGYFIRMILTRLAPKAIIKPHADGGHSLSRCHRIHLPILSNPNCHFQVGGTTLVMKPGEVWEINNRLTHAVSNDGDEPRVHLILDYVQPGETVLDHDGALVA